MQVSQDNKANPLQTSVGRGEAKPEPAKPKDSIRIAQSEPDKLKITIQTSSLPSHGALKVDENRTIAENAQEFHEQNKYGPSQTGVKTQIQVSDRVSAIVDVGEVAGRPMAKVGGKFQGERLSAYAMVDANGGDVDAGVKYKMGQDKNYYVLAETNKMYSNDAQFHRIALGGKLVDSETAKLEVNSFAGYLQGVELKSRYTPGGEHDLGLVGTEIKGRKSFQLSDKVALEMDGRSRITAGAGLRFPEGTKERLEFSQNGEVPTLPGTDIPIDNGISSGLFTNRNEARVGLKVEATKDLTFKPYVKGELTPGSSYTPMYHVAGGANAEYKVSDNVALEAGVDVPLVSSKLYQPITVSSGVKVGHLRLGGYMGLQEGQYQTAGGQISYDHNGKWSLYGNIGHDQGNLSAFAGMRFNFDGPGRSNVSVEAYSRGGSETYAPKPITETTPPVPAGLQTASFEDTVAALDSPEKVAGYDRGYLDYVPHGSGTYTPRETWEKKSGVCRDHARFQASILKSHGYQAYMLSYGGAAVNHAFVAYVDRDGTWNAVEYGQHYKVGARNFEELVASLQDHFSKEKGYNIDWTRVGLIEPDSLQNMFIQQAPFVQEAINRGLDSNLKY